MVLASLGGSPSPRMNHLLKSPFVVHPKTGRVCVPIDPESVNAFDPAQVPTIGKLVEELLPVNTPGNRWVRKIIGMAM